MKSSTFYRLVLFLPYLTLIPGYLLTRDFLVNQSSSGLLSARFLGMSWMVLSGFWIIPYTIVVVGLLVWSKGKSGNIIRSMLLRSPFILMIVMPIVFILVGLLGSYSPDPNTSGFLGGVALLGPICSMPFSLVIGYIFLVIGLLLYEILDKFGYIQDDIQP
jgi:hypothetical protein